MADLPLVRWIDFTVRGDARGDLIAIESQREVPFDIARVYYLPRTEEGVGRGFHAHHTLQQVLISVSGACTILLDDGTQQERVRLDDPARGLAVDPMVWHEMHDFTPDCVLMVLAAAPYDEADYIRDHAEFVALVTAARAEGSPAGA